MAFKIEDLRQKSNGAMYVSPVRLCVTANDELCEETDPAAVRLLVAAGSELPVAEARKYGLISDDEETEAEAKSEPDEDSSEDESEVEEEMISDDEDDSDAEEESEEDEPETCDECGKTFKDVARHKSRMHS